MSIILLLKIIIHRFMSLEIVLMKMMMKREMVILYVQLKKDICKMVFIEYSLQKHNQRLTQLLKTLNPQLLIPELICRPFRSLT